MLSIFTPRVFHASTLAVGSPRVFFSLRRLAWKILCIAIRSLEVEVRS